MAKSKTKKHSPPRRRRVGSAFSDFATVVGGAIIGGVAAQAAGNAATKAGFASPELQAGGKIAAGYFIGSKSKTPFMKGVGLGMAVNGGTHFAQKLGVIKGVDDDGMGDFDEISGVDQSYTGLNEISGDEYSE